MSLIDFKKERQEAVKELNASDMKIEVTETTSVPHVDDSAITYPDTTKKVQKCKQIETCVLYVDMRDSTDISDSHRRDTLAKLYSSFIEAMVQCAHYCSGHVRGIVGDRVMVVFDQKNCFKNAVDTAVLMNSVCQYVINKEFTKNTIRAGIGIDYGKLLVAKAGVVKKGVENSYNKSLVWLGRPANVASKLTDQANKSIYSDEDIVLFAEQSPFKADFDWDWTEVAMKQFLKELSAYYRFNESSNLLQHSSNFFQAFYLSNRFNSKKFPPILMTEPVYKGLCKQDPDRNSVKNGDWDKQDLSVSGYDGDIYGGDIIFTAFRE